MPRYADGVSWQINDIFSSYIYLICLYSLDFYAVKSETIMKEKYVFLSFCLIKINPEWLTVDCRLLSVNYTPPSRTTTMATSMLYNQVGHLMSPQNYSTTPTYFPSSTSHSPASLSLHSPPNTPQCHTKNLQSCHYNSPH